MAKSQYLFEKSWDSKKFFFFYLKALKVSHKSPKFEPQRFPIGWVIQKSFFKKSIFLAHFWPKFWTQKKGQKNDFWITRSIGNMVIQALRTSGDRPTPFFTSQKKKFFFQKDTDFSDFFSKQNFFNENFWIFSISKKNFKKFSVTFFGYKSVW
jgi:hypothetical protein